MTGKGGNDKEVLEPKDVKEIIAVTKKAHPDSKISEIRLAIRYKLNNEGKKAARAN